MTVVTWLLLPLLLAAAAGCAVAAVPAPAPPRHPFDTDPFADDGEHVGQHRHPEDQEPTVRLGDSRLR